MTRLSITLAALLLCSSLPAQQESAIQPGDHVAIIGNTYADQLRANGWLETLLVLRSAEDPVSVRNLGWAGDMLHARDRPTNFPGETSLLEEHKTDVIVACFGMGESFDGPEGIPTFRRNLLELLKRHEGKSYNGGKSKVRIVLVSPIAPEDLGDFTPRHEERSKSVAAYSQAIAAIAAERKIAFTDLHGPSRQLLEKPGPRLTTNGINLGNYGYWALARESADQLLPGEEGWTLHLDAAQGKVTKQRGLECNEIRADGQKRLSFSVKELHPPSPAPPGNPGAKIHEALAAQLDRLVVTGLPAGEHRLFIGEHEVLSASAAEFAQGLVLRDTPAHQQLEAFRALVHDKNEQWIYSWKALNQVHIVGERKSSASGKAIPAELIEFRKIVAQREAEITKGISLSTRPWQIIPAK